MACIDTSKPHIIFYFTNADCANCTPLYGATILELAKAHDIEHTQIALLLDDVFREKEHEIYRDKLFPDREVTCVFEDKDLHEKLMEKHNLHNGCFYAISDGTPNYRTIKNFKS